MRPRRFDRMSRQFNIDKDLDEWLREKFPGLASEKANSLLRADKEREDKKVIDLIGSDTNAGRMAYSQSMERLNYVPQTSWKSLSPDKQLEFMDIYKRRLVELQARGF